MRVSYVLIDTWWNVNISRISPTGKATKVLIDTWWNVNTNVTSNIAGRCEVLIDTWWNVNAVGVLKRGENMEF